MVLYNSLSRKKEEFQPITPGKVGFYTCGPTVYDYQHIGNMRAYITWDILKRFLMQQGYDVTHIMNITDVGHLTTDADEGDDKMLLAAKREKTSALEIAKKYFNVFKDDVEKLNIIAPTKYVKATEHIKEQIALVNVLEEKGYTYQISDGIYFDTSKFKEYGKLSRKELSSLLPGARVEMNLEKHNPSDFALWKFSPEVTDGQKRAMEWNSPWGKGFPGWHLECSAMSMKYLGDTFDIHTGGKDHLTVHHNNEIAQSQAASGKPLAHFWLHLNFLCYKDKKISKSAGTFIKLDDIIAGGVSPLAYRYFLLQAHYRKELCYSWDAVKAAQKGLNNIYTEISFYNQASGGIQEYEEKFERAMSDDLNSAKALSAMQKLINIERPTSDKLQSLFKMDEVLGLRLKEEWARRQILPAQAKQLLAERQKAREEKQWNRADALREKLENLDVLVMDTTEGQKAAVRK